MKPAVVHVPFAGSWNLDFNPLRKERVFLGPTISRRLRPKTENEQILRRRDRRSLSVRHVKPQLEIRYRYKDIGFVVWQDDDTLLYGFRFEIEGEVSRGR